MTMTANKRQAKKDQANQGSRMLALIFAMFTLPLLLAAMLYHMGYIGAHPTNAGHLLRPPLTLHSLDFSEAGRHHPHSIRPPKKWLLVYFNPGHHCSPACRQTLHTMRQVWLATGKYRNRIQRMLWTSQHFMRNTLGHRGLSEATLLRLHHPGLINYTLSHDSLVQLNTIASKHHIAHGALFLVDPHGNIPMLYPADTAPKGLLHDIKHLLRVSQIG